MAISYDPLWKTMQEKGITQYKIIQQGIDSKTMYAIRKGNYISTNTLERICHILDCTPNDVICFLEDEVE